MNQAKPRPGDLDRGGGYGQTPAGFLYCARCGCLIMEGYQAEHDYVHAASLVSMPQEGPIPI